MDSSMAQTASSELETWLASDRDQPKSLLVLVKTPLRNVDFRSGRRSRALLPKTVRGPSRQQREAAIHRLQQTIENELHTQALPLVAAGALAVNATPEVARRILALPGVKSVAPNRRIGGK